MSWHDGGSKLRAVRVAPGRLARVRSPIGRTSRMCPPVMSEPITITVRYAPTASNRPVTNGMAQRPIRQNTTSATISAQSGRNRIVLVRLAHGCEGSYVDAGLKPGDGRVLTRRAIHIGAPALCIHRNLCAVCAADGGWLKQSRAPKSLFLVLNSLFFKRFSLLI